jgi:hypothetical protein
MVQMSVPRWHRCVAKAWRNAVGTDGLRQTGTADGHLGGCVDEPRGYVMATGDPRTRAYGEMRAATAS